MASLERPTISATGMSGVAVGVGVGSRAEHPAITQIAIVQMTIKPGSRQPEKYLNKVIQSAFAG